LVAQPVAVISGAGGLIGSYLMQAAERWASGWRVEGLTRRRLDLTDDAALCRFWREVHPDLVIHCAALSKPQHCHRRPDLARKVNVDVTARLAELTRDSRFILLSTDQVFDGRCGGYDEASDVNPITVYAETKVAAERIILANPKHTVIRTSLNAGLSPTGDRSFNEEIRRAWEEGRTLKLFTDEYRCPIPAEVTARAVWELALQHPPGLYHVAGTERLSRWAIGQLLAACWPRLTTRMEASSIAGFKDFPRQPDLSLNCAKARALLSFDLPAFSDWLKANPAELK
jgi:dTDP-4-dehydrorhamnose reductase